MKKIIAFVTLTIFLTSCSTHKDSFTRKKECQELYNTVVQKMMSRWSFTENERTAGWWKTNTGLQIEEPQIYYSQKLESCIYKSEVISSYVETRSESINRVINLVDIFSNRDITEINCTTKTSWFDEKLGPQYTLEDLKESSKCLEDINKKLKELKTE